MHAVVTRVTVNDREAATSRLREQIVPQVSQAPGFVTGYWTRGDDGTGVAMVIFESEDAATNMSERVPSMLTDAVTLQNVEVREVVANA